MTHLYLLCFITLISTLEAIFFHFQRTRHWRPIRSIHLYLNLIRLIAYGFFFYYTDWLDTLSWLFLFPFFHDGVYYTMRHILDRTIYGEMWIAEASTESTAYVDVKWEMRQTLALIGTFGLALNFLFL